MKRILLLVSWFIVLQLHSYGQEQKIFTYSQLVKDLFIQQPTLDTLKYVNVYFQNDLPNQGEESFRSEYVGWDYQPIKGGFKEYLANFKVKKDTANKYHVNWKYIEFTNCKFDNDLRFSNVVFHGDLTFIENEFPNQTADWGANVNERSGGALLIDSCKVLGKFGVENSKDQPYKFYTKFNNSSFNEFHVVLPKSRSQIYKSTFKGQLWIQVVGSTSILHIDTCKFEQISHPIAFLTTKLPPINTFDSGQMSIKNSIFRDTSQNFVYFYFESDKVVLSKNTFDAKMRLSYTNP